jgi:hypothetical protein
MNAESLGHYLFGLGKPERRSKVTKLDSAKSLTPGEGRCATGVCEVAWKPNQPNNRDLDQNESISRGD